MKALACHINKSDPTQQRLKQQQHKKSPRTIFGSPSKNSARKKKTRKAYFCVTHKSVKTYACWTYDWYKGQLMPSVFSFITLVKIKFLRMIFNALVNEYILAISKTQTSPPACIFWKCHNSSSYTVPFGTYFKILDGLSLVLTFLKMNSPTGTLWKFHLDLKSHLNANSYF